MSLVYRRHRFELTATAGTTKGDTGPPFWGEVVQTRWSPTTDTGTSLTLALIPEVADTGQGHVFFQDTGHMRTENFRSPRVNPFTDGTGSSDTGFVTVVSAGDHLRVKIVNKGAVNPVTGTFYVWTRN